MLWGGEIMHHVVGRWNNVPWILCAKTTLLNTENNTINECMFLMPIIWIRSLETKHREKEKWFFLLLFFFLKKNWGSIICLIFTTLRFWRDCASRVISVPSILLAIALKSYCSKKLLHYYSLKKINKNEKCINLIQSQDLTNLT